MTLFAKDPQYVEIGKGNLYANVSPHLPKNSEIDTEKVKILNGGISVALDISEPQGTGFNEGQSYLLERFVRYSEEKQETRISLGLPYRKMIIPPLWALAHMYLESEQTRNFLNRNLVTSSSTRSTNRTDIPEKEAGTIYVTHQVKVDSNVMDIDRDNYGMRIPLALTDYPTEEMPLNRLIREYPIAAQALFLMDEEQLDRFLSRVPDITYDAERPAEQGAGFIDSAGHIHKPYVFGSRCSVERYDRFSSHQDEQRFFGQHESVAWEHGDGVGDERCSGLIEFKTIPIKINLRRAAAV